MTMEPKILLQSGKLTEALTQLTQEVKAQPTDTQRRTFLFELLCFAGDFQRAERQLDTLGHQNATLEVGVEVYRNILKAEEARSRLLSDGLKPTFLFESPAYIHYHLDAVNRLREGRPNEVKTLMGKSREIRPQVKGTIDGEAFTDFLDADDLIAPVLEVIVHNTYVWLPFEQIKKVSIAQPKQLRDLLWIPATIEAKSQPVGEVFLPVLYLGTSQSSNDQLRLGRMTDWESIGDGLNRGIGQRLFTWDNQDRAILETREIEIV